MVIMEAIHLCSAIDMKDEEKNIVRISVYVPEWVRTAIKKEIAPTTQTQSGWVLEQIVNVLQELGYRQPIRYGSLADLVEDNLDLLRSQTRIPEKELQELLNGTRCSDITLLRIAMTLDISEDEIQSIAHRSKQ